MSARADKPRILHLPIKRQWFDMIVSGEKRAEYREIKPHWNDRLANRHYDLVRFRNGYSETSPTITLQCLGINMGRGRPEWGAPDHTVYIIWLGEVVGRE